MESIKDHFKGKSWYEENYEPKAYVPKIRRNEYEMTRETFFEELNY